MSKRKFEIIRYFQVSERFEVMAEDDEEAYALIESGDVEGCLSELQPDGNDTCEVIE